MARKLPVGIDGFEKIINYGIAFYKKNCKVRMAYGINGSS